MAKKICKTDNEEKIEKKQAEPKFRCKKCGEPARKEKNLCKPEPIGK